MELRKDDTDLRKPPLEVDLYYLLLASFISWTRSEYKVFIYQAMHPREPGSALQKWAETQVAVGARVACYHDEIKVSLPAIWTPTHHLLFTFYHVDLQTKIEAPKPVSAFIHLRNHV